MSSRKHLKSLVFAALLGLATLARVSRANAQVALLVEGIDAAEAALLGETVTAGVGEVVEGGAELTELEVVDNEGNAFHLVGHWEGKRFIARDGRAYEKVFDSAENEFVLRVEFKPPDINGDLELPRNEAPFSQGPAAARRNCDIPFVPPARSPFWCTTSNQEQVEECRREANQSYAAQVASSRQEWQRRRLECEAREQQRYPERPPTSATAPMGGAQIAYGRYCATPVGLFGPGQSNPIGSRCHASDSTGTYSGTVSSGVGPDGEVAYGEYCQTSVGIRGPGPANLVGLRCHATDRTGTHYGTVTAQAPELGQYCATQVGIVGPGVANPVGSPCNARTPQGVFRGSVVKHR